jgi:hypothetical protein
MFADVSLVILASRGRAVQPPVTWTRWLPGRWTVGQKEGWMFPQGPPGQMWCNTRWPAGSGARRTAHSGGRVVVCSLGGGTRSRTALGRLRDVVRLRCACARLGPAAGAAAAGGFAGERSDREVVGLDWTAYPGSWDAEEPALRLRSTMGVCTGATFLMLLPLRLFCCF